MVFAVIWRVDPQRVVTGDTASYENPALALVETGRFNTGRHKGAKPETLRTPGYPVFLAGLYTLFGERRDIVVVTQVLLSTCTVLLLYGLGFQLSMPTSALAAAAFLILDPLSFVYSQLLFSETLFTFVLMLSLWCAIKLLLGGPVWWSGAFGLSLAAATMIRPIAYYLIVPSIIGLVLYGRIALRWKGREIATAALLVLIPWCALVEGWRVRNYTATGSIVFSQIQPYNLLWYRGGGIVAVRDGVSFEDARTQIAASLPDMNEWSVADINARYVSEGLTLIRDHPLLFLRNQLFGVFKVTVGPGRSDLDHYVSGIPYAEVSPEAVWFGDGRLVRSVSDHSGSRSVVLYSIVYTALLYAGVGWGIVAMLYKTTRRAADLFLWGVVIYLIVMAAGPESYARFRVPVMPILSLYAGCGWDHFKSMLRSTGKRS